MKKNISINISGIIFHIEEDGYERLKAYLESINSYFSTFDDSNEIVADIEGRIAEIFLTKLSEEKQVITLEDVGNLIKTMGSISDFEAIEEPGEEPIKEKTASESAESSEETAGRQTASKRLYRDLNRKLLGGVAAGIAHYFSIDPIWVRLLLLLFLLGQIPGAAVLLVSYIIFWIVVPGSTELEEDTQLKKMFRNPEGKVIGGVANGLAAYFGTDVTVIRLLFVVSILLGGAGIILYIILWIITPEAKSITEKLQMQGEPVTLSGIESNIKESLKVEEGEESLLVKILLFPFRLIAVIFTGLGKALGPILLFLVEIIRIASGVLLIIIGITSMFAFIIAAAVLFGIISKPFYMEFGNLPLDFFTNTVPTFPLLALFIMSIIPPLFLMLLGVSIIAKRIVFNATTGWSIFAIWIVSMIIVGITAPSVIIKFRDQSNHRVTNQYDLQNKTAVLELNDLGDDEYESVNLRIRGHEETDYKLVFSYSSKGSSRREAEKNAARVKYNVELEDSVFLFDSKIELEEDDEFRFQRLHMDLYIPYGQEFTMDEDLRYIIGDWFHGYSMIEASENRYIFNEEGDLKCITCEDEEYDKDEYIDEGNEYDPDEDAEVEVDEDDYEPLSGYLMEYDLDGISSINIASSTKANIIRSNNARMIISGDSDYAEDLDVTLEDDYLEVNYEGRKKLGIKESNEEVRIDIFVPSVYRINLKSASDAHIYGFSGEELKMDIFNSSATVDGNFDFVYAELNGSFLKMYGDGKELILDLKRLSKVEALEYEVDECEIEAKGASSAKLHVNKLLDVEAGGLSSVRFKGNPELSGEDKDSNAVKSY